jgi:protein-arginine kinase activator protein McsA
MLTKQQIANIKARAEYHTTGQVIGMNTPYLDVLKLIEHIEHTHEWQWICSHCSSFQASTYDDLHAGVTFTCSECKKDTVIDLVRAEDYVTKPLNPNVNQNEGELKHEA